MKDGWEFAEYFVWRFIYKINEDVNVSFVTIKLSNWLLLMETGNMSERLVKKMISFFLPIFCPYCLVKKYTVEKNEFLCV